MKTKTLILALLAIVSFNLNAQDEYSNYLNKAFEKLEEGDCKAAQKFYNVYKELSEKSVVSFEVLLEECVGEKKYSVGDNMIVNGQTYTVAYTRDEGRHGLAIFKKGWDSLTNNLELYITRKGIPTIEELDLIYANKDKVGLFDVYWSCSKTSGCAPTCYAYKDFATGKGDHTFGDNTRFILLIYRF